MTKKKIAESRIVPLQLRLFMLRELALKIIATKFEPDAEGAPVLASGERKFLAVALWHAGHGFDANEAFGVKAKRGEHRKRAHVEGRPLSPFQRHISVHLSQPGKELMNSLQAGLQNGEPHEDTP